MKLRKLIFTIIVLFFSHQFYSAQEKPQPILFYEFEKTNCDSLQILLEKFISSLTASSHSKGYILMNGSRNKTYPFDKYFWEKEMQIDLAFLGFDRSRIIFLQGEDKEVGKTQFWVVPEGADKPDFVETRWNYSLPPDIKPFIINKDSWIGEVCKANYNTDFYAKVLLANPDLTGRLVIYNKSIRSYNQRKSELFKELISEKSVSQRQLEFFYRKSKKADTEFWFIPKKRS